MPTVGGWHLVDFAWGILADADGFESLRVSVRPKEMTLELLEFDLECSGGYICDHPKLVANKPRENVNFVPTTKKDLARVTGTLVLRGGEDGAVKVKEAEGWFGNASEKK